MQLRLLLSTTLLIIAQCAIGGNHLVDDQSIMPARPIEICSDCDSLFSFEDVQANGNFEAVQAKGIVNLPPKESAYWLKINIQNNTSRTKLILNFLSPNVRELSVFYELKGEVISDTTGASEPFDNRSFHYASFLFEIPIPKGTSKDIYIRAHSTEPVKADIILGTAKNILHDASNRTVWFGLFIGIFIAMALYNLFVYITVREKSYMLYVLHTIAAGLTQMAILGYGFQYLWPNSPSFQNISSGLFTVMVSLIGLEFLKEFLNTKVNAPKLHKLARVFTVVYSVYILLFLFHIEIGALYRILQPIQGIVSLFVLITAIVVHNRGYRPARFYLIAWSVFMAGIFIYVLAEGGVLPNNSVTASIMPIGSVMEVILLSFALADKINILKREKEDANNQALDLARENERIVLDQNKQLEAKVAERTIDLEQTVSQLNEAYDSLKSAQTQLVSQEKMASLGQLTAGIAHEINNPINFVSANVIPLKRDIEDVLELFAKAEEIIGLSANEEQKSELIDLKTNLEFDYIVEEIDTLLRGMKEGSDRTVEIVRGLRSFSRVDEQDLKTIDIHEGIDSTLILLNNSMKDKVKVNKDYGRIENVDCFPGKINQVFMNIISNASQAIQEQEKNDGEGTITIRTSMKDENTLQIIIADDGPGIPEEHLDQLFDPFFTTKPVGEGTGLGLSISYNIIKSHKGTLRAESTVGEGTSFIIELPLTQQ